jgi:phage/plasmid-associated DNA primase
MDRIGPSGRPRGSYAVCPGLGKSQIVQAVFEILNTYAQLINESLLSKNGSETKRFDMADWIGKRMGFMDETQLGMTWDETRMSRSASAEYLSAELKFGRRLKFLNTLKITVVGNHKPNFAAAETGGLTRRITAAVGELANNTPPGPVH